MRTHGLHKRNDGKIILYCNLCDAVLLDDYLHRLLVLRLLFPTHQCTHSIRRHSALERAKVPRMAGCGKIQYRLLYSHMVSNLQACSRQRRRVPGRESRGPEGELLCLALLCVSHGV